MQKTLIERATFIVGKINLNGFKNNSSGEVSSALVTKKGNIYTGICIDIACSMGFCAEHAAVAEMLKSRETEINMVVAVRKDGKVIPPCGRCREMMVQVNISNLKTMVIVEKNLVLPLEKLLPHTWSTV
ncbi:MAG: cytidine deaminase [Candidatus Paraimprobicoccus trichonymphae]|uniref:Cytidine deaminase n=1 Tax=Candidatus Paraimprobicoccus trichonymphae TaxID=3033793 RepID=A0AA48ICR3_9FIRM|nr:MAG: cytidine deaminase [Candidatus Paraimprobicoccus trichonymphae]